MVVAQTFKANESGEIFESLVLDLSNVEFSGLRRLSTPALDAAVKGVLESAIHSPDEDVQEQR